MEFKTHISIASERQATIALRSATAYTEQHATLQRGPRVNKKSKCGCRLSYPARTAPKQQATLRSDSNILTGPTMLPQDLQSHPATAAGLPRSADLGKARNTSTRI